MTLCLVTDFIGIWWRRSLIFPINESYLWREGGLSSALEKMRRRQRRYFPWLIHWKPRSGALQKRHDLNCSQGGNNKWVRASSVLVQCDNKIIRIAQEVEHYLLTHPYAADSLENIVKWWIGRQRFEESLDHVLRALDILIDRGRVLKIKNADGTCIYKKKEEDKDPPC